MKHPEEPSDDFGTRWRKITKGLPAGDRSLAIAFEKALLQQILVGGLNPSEKY
jgi:hypothetical protein